MLALLKICKEDLAMNTADDVKLRCCASRQIIVRCFVGRAITITWLIFVSRSSERLYIIRNCRVNVHYERVR